MKIQACSIARTQDNTSTFGTKSSASSQPTIPIHPLGPHTFFNRSPDTFYNLSIPPAAVLRIMLIPLINLDAHHASTPTFHRRRYLFAPPPDMDPKRMAKQLWRALPFILLELPRLSRCEHSRKPRPVFGLEHLGVIDENEADWTDWIDGV